jgi:hypothetical protein
MSICSVEPVACSCTPPPHPPPPLATQAVDSIGSIGYRESGITLFRPALRDSCDLAHDRPKLPWCPIEKPCGLDGRQSYTSPPSESQMEKIIARKNWGGGGTKVRRELRAQGSDEASPTTECPGDAEIRPCVLDCASWHGNNPQFSASIPPAPVVISLRRCACSCAGSLLYLCFLFLLCLLPKPQPNRMGSFQCGASSSTRTVWATSNMRAG